MTALELRKLLMDVDDETPIVFSIDGEFYDAGIEESGLIVLEETDNGIKIDAFAILPEGFYEDPLDDFSLN